MWACVNLKLTTLIIIRTVSKNNINIHNTQYTNTHIDFK